MLERLREPFRASEVKTRVGRVFSDGKAGIIFLYIDARACQDRLDEVCGVSGWSTAFRFEKMQEGAIVVCELTVNIDGTEVKRSDCSELTEVSEAKGSASSAFKRACSALGIGRYLYNVGELKARLDNKRFCGKVLLPDEYLPEEDRQGRAKLEIVYDASAPQYATDYTAPRADTQNVPANVKAAMEYVIQTGKLAGKTLGEVTDKVLGWLHYNATNDAEKAAADTLYKYRKQLADAAQSATPPDDAPDDVDIPF